MTCVAVGGRLGEVGGCGFGEDAGDALGAGAHVLDGAASMVAYYAADPEGGDEMTVESTGLEDMIRELDMSIDALASGGDFEALGRLLAADFRYNHSTGASQDKTEWLEGLKPLVGRRERNVSAVKVEVHGNVAVAMGDLDIVWTDGRHNYDRYVRVYRSEDGEWLAISQRTVPAPDRAGA